MDSKKLKGLLILYLRFNRSSRYCATECGYFSADVLAIIGNYLVEIETKISMSDLRADLNKLKHGIYLNANTVDDYGVPNFFYFCVPYELKEKALKFLDENLLPYGLMATKDPSLKLQVQQGVEIVRKSKKLKKEKVDDRMKDIIASRMSSELASQYLKIIRGKK